MDNTNTSSSSDTLELPALHAIGRSKAGRKLAITLSLILVTLPVLLLLVPWQQNVPGAGRLTALDPLDRIQVIPAPVTGRLTKLNVREGTRVTEGQELAIMEDLDPNFAARLDLQVGFAEEKRSSAEQNLLTLDRQLASLTRSRKAAVESAERDYEQSIEKILEEESKLVAEQETLGFLTEDFARQSRLLAAGGLASVQTQEKAKAAAGNQTAKVKAALSAVEQARKERDSKKASVRKIMASEQAKIDEVQGKELEAQQKLQDALNSVEDAKSKQARQATRKILSPRNGTILRIEGANSSDLIKAGERLMEVVPDTEDFAVEMWMRGVDAPLVQIGRKARMQFEGWPAVQFAGWPSVAVGTFGGIVAQADAQAAADGRVRLLIVPDLDDLPWPDEMYLRQGVRASGWVQLETVSSGYELWRQLNAFPPSIQTAPSSEGSGDKGGSKKSKSDMGDKDQ